MISSNTKFDQFRLGWIELARQMLQNVKFPTPLIFSKPISNVKVY